MLTLEQLREKKHLHFIGIGGSGMYPIVQILHSQGYHITGSDNNETETLDAVRDMGIEVHLGQRAENIAGADLIIYTAAVLDDNPELAEKYGIMSIPNFIFFKEGKVAGQQVGAVPKESLVKMLNA